MLEAEAHARKFLRWLAQPEVRAELGTASLEPHEHFDAVIGAYRTYLERRGAVALEGTESPKARTYDPETAVAAAQDNGHRVKDQRRQMLRALAAAPRGLTAAEASEAAAMPLNSASTRLSEMARHDPPLIVAPGEKRRTPSGARARVYYLTDLGRAVVNG